MKTTSVFEKNLIAYTSGSKLIVNQGGTRSSKTYSILQLLVIIAERSTKPLVISVASKVLPHLKLGAMRDIDNILLSLGYVPDAIKNRTDNIYKIGNSIIEFFGIDNLGKVHGPARDILFVNEGNYIKHDIFTQLTVRTTGTVFMDFNPTRAFWYHEEIQGKFPHTFIKSTYQDNEFLSQDQIDRIEERKGNVHWWQVYGLGELGRLEGAIYENWKFGEFDNSLPYVYGLDFGVKDPDALVKVAIDRKNKLLYWKEEVYKNGLSTPQLHSLISSRGVKESLIIADSADSRTIMDLRNMGLNIVPVKKPRIVDRIKAVWDYEIIVDPDSYNLEKELSSYVWLDKRGEVPIDDFCHLLDAAGYASTHLMPPDRSDKLFIYIEN